MVKRAYPVALPRSRVPAFPRFRRSGLPVPTGDGAAVAMLAALLLFVAINLQAGWVYAVDALLIGLLLVGWISAWVSVRGIAATRALPPEAVEHDRLGVTLELATHRWARYFLELHEPSPALAADPQVVPVLAPGRPVRIVFEATAPRRGVYRLDALEVRSGGMTGLFAARALIPAPAGLTVFPRYWTLADLPVPSRAFDERTAVLQPRHDASEVAGVRDFRSGDSPRHIHWRSTARRSVLVVKEFAWDTSEAPVLLLDTRPSVHAGTGSGTSFEDLARAAASVAQYVTRSGRPVQIVTGRRVSTDRAVVGWRQALHLLAGLSPEGAASPLELHATLPPGTAAVVISPDADAVAALAQRGAAISVVLLDAASYKQSSQSPRSAQSPRSHAATSANSRSEDRVDREDRADREDSTTAAEMLLRALGVPVAVVRQGEEVGACLRSWVQ